MKKMHSRELGLVLAKQLLDVEDLHYGLWDADLELKLGNMAIAQQRYNEMLIAQLPKPDGGVRVLDIGCGAGHLLRQLLDRGYGADGVIPARDLADAVRLRLADHAGYKSRLFECRLEDLPLEPCRGYYDVALFSESFQYIPLSASLPRLQEILKPRGLLVICDFFKTEALGDGARVGDPDAHDARAAAARGGVVAEANTDLEMVAGVEGAVVDGRFLSLEHHPEYRDEAVGTGESPGLFL